MNGIDRTRLLDRLAEERRRFAAEHPRSRALFEQAKKNLLGGVPMTWMVKWAGKFPVFVREGNGAHLTDIDGHRYLDLCLGDTGAMMGHAPPATVAALIEQAQRGLTFMLPTEDAIWVARELENRFGLPFWEFALTATDANRFAIRRARQITGRRLILVFNWCYHGTVDETFITLQDGVPQARHDNPYPAVDPTTTTRVVEFNDIPALEAALAPGDVACVLAEPALTNIGIVLPEPGFHAALREITRATGTLLIIDETHTICAGPGGYTRAYGLEPDVLTIGKPIAGGMPAAAYGFSDAVAGRIYANRDVKYEDQLDISGVGGTLAGNALSLAATKATLQHVLTREAFDWTIPLAERFAAGVQSVIDAFELPWHVTQLGCRVEYRFRPEPPRSGAQAAAAADPDLDDYMHLAALNRGILMTPFHNMALIAPDTTEEDVDTHTRVFRESVEALMH
jgi:glutamate-1-semialdehyde 2,1-aminomutase